MSRTIDEVRARLSNVRWKKKNGELCRAQCPCRRGGRTLSVQEEPDGRVLVHCFRCNASQDKIARALGMRPNEFFPRDERYGWQSEWREIDRYRYDDEEGNKLYEKVRYEDPAGEKHFRFVGPDDSSGLPENVRHVLYKLPAVLHGVGAGQTIYLVEGEKDANNLIDLGLVATTSDGGADQRWPASYSGAFSGADVVIVPDNDSIGRRHAEVVADALVPLARSVRVLVLPGLPVKGDVTDWLALEG